MSIKQNGGVFGRNPTFNDVTIEGDLIINGEVFTGLDFQGSWNASTNSPALASSVGTNGEFYIVSVAGATDLNGITNWGIGDWAIFNGTAWQRVEGGADGNFNDVTVAGTLEVTGEITANGGIALGDSDKATFGASDDLQIYHDGNNSYINDAGTGALLIRGSNVSLAKYTGETMVNALADGRVDLYYDNAIKLTTVTGGIDVTGNMIADGVGIGTSSPTRPLTVSQTGAQIVGEFINPTAAQTARIYVTCGTQTGQIQIKGNTHATDPNTLSLNTSAGDIALVPSGVEVVRVTPSGFVGIGNNATAPTALLELNDSADLHFAMNKYGVAGFDIFNKGTAGTELGTVDPYSLILKTHNTERMRIDSSGNVLVGTTSNSPSTGGVAIRDVNGTTGVVAIGHATGVSGGNYFASFQYGTNVIGSITQSGTGAVAYNTSSDYRLKEDVQAMSGATDRLKELKPVNFAWKVDGSRVDGFLAHEAQEVVPESVTGSKDAMQDEEYEVTPAVYEDVTTPAVEAVEGVEAIEAVEAVDAVYDDEGIVVSEAIEAVEAVEGVEAVEAQAETTESVLVTEAVMGTRSVPDYQGIDQSKLVPLLTATIQELIARIETLEGK